MIKTRLGQVHHGMFRNKGPSHRGTMTEMSTRNKVFASTTQRQAGAMALRFRLV